MSTNAKTTATNGPTEVKTGGGKKKQNMSTNTKTTATNGPTEVKTGGGKKKQNPFKNAPKTVFCFMSTAEGRDLTAQEWRGQKPNKEEYRPRKKEEYYRPPKKEEKKESKSELLQQIQEIKEKLQKKEVFINLEKPKSKSAEKDLDWYIQLLKPLERDFQEEHNRRKILDEEISKCKEVLGDFQGNEVVLTEKFQLVQSKSKQAQKTWSSNELDDFGEVEDLKSKNQQLEELVQSNVELAAKLEKQEKENEPLQQEVTELTKQLDVLMEAAKGQFKKDTGNPVSEQSNVCEPQKKKVQHNKKGKKKKNRH